MKGFIIVDVKINDAARFEDYKKLTPASLKPFEGRFVVRGGKTDTLEGDWNPQRIVIIEFPSVEKAKAWWSSEEYAPAKALRQSCAVAKMIVAEGFE